MVRLEGVIREMGELIVLVEMVVWYDNGDCGDTII